MPVAGEPVSRPARDYAACASVTQALGFLVARTRPPLPRILIDGSLYLAGACCR